MRRWTAALLWRGRAPYVSLCYAVGAGLIVLGFVHGAVFLVDGGSWSGPVSWRKPMTFGVSFGLTTATIGWVLGWLRIDALTGWLLAVPLAAGSTYEVGWVTAQRWRGVPSHFAEQGTDEAVWALAGMVIALVGLVLVAVTLLAFTRLQAPAGLAFAIRAGLVILLAGQVVGALIVANGNAIAAPPTAVDHAVFGEAGAMKVPHAIAMHAIQLLPLLAWVLWRVGVDEPRRMRVAAAASVGYGGLVVVSALQTFRGLATWDLDVLAGGLLAASLTVLLTSFVVAGRAVRGR